LSRLEPGLAARSCLVGLKTARFRIPSLIEQIDFKTPAPALTAQVNCAYAYAYAAASHADARLAEHFQKQNALKGRSPAKMNLTGLK